MILKGRYIVGAKKREDGTIDFFDASDKSATGKRVVGFLKNNDPENRQRFIREATMLSGISHANVARVIDHGEENGTCFMVMEQAGKTYLHEKLDGNAGLPWRDVKPLLSGICDGLDAIHSSGAVHADLKPSKITLYQTLLLSSALEDPKILPSGFARFLANDIPTKPGYVCGTVSYMSPEQATPSTHLDIRSDIYSFGVMAYELLTGDVPFRGDNILGTIMMHRNKIPLAPSKKAPRIWIPASLDALVMTALQKNPDKRFQSALELKAAIESC